MKILYFAFGNTTVAMSLPSIIVNFLPLPNFIGNAL